jgi:uncharacterized SAM-binding protein YcdF (DUF218 family)
MELDGPEVLMPWEGPWTFVGLAVFVIALPWTFTGLIVRAILAGRLVPGRELEYSRALVTELTDQNRLLLDGGRVARDLFTEVRDVVEHRRDP